MKDIKKYIIMILVFICAALAGSKFYSLSVSKSSRCGAQVACYIINPDGTCRNVCRWGGCFGDARYGDCP